MNCPFLKELKSHIYRFRKLQRVSGYTYQKTSPFDLPQKGPTTAVND